MNSIDIVGINIDHDYTDYDGVVNNDNKSDTDYEYDKWNMLLMTYGGENNL